MQRFKPLSNCFALALIVAACSGSNEGAPDNPLRTIALSRTIRIPARVLDADTAGALQQNPGILSMTAGAADELPRGPEGFEVLAEGGFVLTDPLQRRLVLYDSQGNYRAAWPTSFAANVITRLSDDRLEVGEATSEDFYVFDQAGQFQQQPNALHSQIVSARGEARLLSHTHGIVLKPGALSGAADTLKVDFSVTGKQMISLQSLGTDRQGNTYVAVESTAGSSETIAVQKSIRKYAANGKLLAEIKDIPLDYYVQPSEEFRVHEGVVYQLLPKQNEVLINVWDTN